MFEKNFKWKKKDFTSNQAKIFIILVEFNLCFDLINGQLFKNHQRYGYVTAVKYSCL